MSTKLNLFFRPLDFNFFNSEYYDLQLVLIILILFTILGLSFTIFCVSYINKGESSISASLASVSFTVELLMFTLVFLGWGVLSTRSNLYTPSFIYSDNLFFVDFYSSTIICLILISTMLILLMSKNYILQSKKDTLEFATFLLFTVLFMSFFLTSLDFLSAFIALEGLSFTLYVLAAMNFSSHASIEAAVKYFCLGGVSSGILLFGITLVYALWGSTNFYFIRIFLKNSEFSSNVSFAKICFFIISLILFGFFFKLSVFPCHIWTPDVYEGSPLIITAFFAIIVKSTIFFFFLKLITFVFYYAYSLYKPLLIVGAIGSLIIGCLGALLQKKIKRFIAYTSINQIGFLLLGLSFNTFNSFWATILHLLIYIVMSFGLFSFLLGVTDNFDQNCIRYILDLSFFGKSHPILGWYLTILLFSMAGIPPLGGFFGKYFILLSGVESNSIFLVVLALFFNIISTFYYIRLIKIIWFGSSAKIKDLTPFYFDKHWVFFTILNFSSLFIISLIFFLPSLINLSISLIEKIIIC